jgi:pyruvate/2-oxoglutarate dehydrogenase complex dihydrolipoamide acyltransferase (E2) component
MTIISKYHGTCGTCGGSIKVGDPIIWVRGQRVTHADAAACQASQALAAVQVAASAVAPAPRPTVDLVKLVAFLRAARDRGLKAPKVRFAAPGNGELLINLAGDASKNPGAVYVKLNGEYVGKVTAQGAAYGLDALLPTLKAIEADPAGAGAAYGALTGRCSFCGLALTDEGSIEVGYGPVCASRYGLPHKPKGSAKVVPVVNVAPVAADGSFRSQAGIDWAVEGGSLAVKTSLCTDCGGYHAPGRRNCDSYDAL